MNEPSPAKKAEWKERASLKNAIVPKYFEVFPQKVILECGLCSKRFVRALIFGIDEPIFVCPECSSRNWVPVRFK